MGTRRKARELALQALYQRELAKGADSLTFAEFCSHFQVAKKAIPYAGELVSGIDENWEAINSLLRQHSINWRLERMSIIDRNILRLAAFELFHKEDVPPQVAINEAVEIAKQYSTDESAAFINGILDAMIKQNKQDIR